LIKYYNQQNKLHSLNADLDALKVLEQIVLLCAKV